MKKGFTLIEIMVVITILGVLVTMISGSYIASQKKSRDIKRKSDIAQIGKALELYNSDNGRYPVSDNGKITGCGDVKTTPSDCTAGTVWQDSGTSTIYMAELPKDPSGQVYFYESTDGTYYRIYARLENTDDNQIRTFTTICSGTATVCNFGVSSPNVQP